MKETMWQKQKGKDWSLIMDRPAIEVTITRKNNVKHIRERISKKGE